MKRRLVFAILLVFVGLCAACVGILMRSERQYKEQVLSARLETCADVVESVLNREKSVLDGENSLEGIDRILPEGVRVTVIDSAGFVMFDSSTKADGNHSGRPEIRESLEKGSGVSLRRSDSDGQEYIYYARTYGDHIVRTALPFTLERKKMLHPDWMIALILALMVAVAALCIMLITKRMNEENDKETDNRLRSQKKDLTNNIAHELRTPVTSIRGYLETVISNPGMDSAKKNSFIEKAYRQSLRLSCLIKDIALITKMEQAPDMLTKEHVGIRHILEDVFEELEGSIVGSGVRVENLVSPETSVNGNQGLLYALFRNLVENSLQYAGRDFVIHVEAHESADGKLLVRYYDTGRGVEEKYLEKIFERFFRVPAPDKCEGSGLGLSIVRNAVAFHGGTVSARQLGGDVRGGGNWSGSGLEIDFTLKK